MDDKKICQDLEEDEELASLRLAALATLKNRENKKSEPVIVATNNILPINSITRTNDYTSEHSSRGNQLWRNNAQSSRRRSGTKHFSKSSQRSNLIVITPVGSENKVSSTAEKSTAPQLLLPQHKWCQAGNEDSSSPKIDRKTGPTRFNRHESGSESSDSDFDDSDDSYSNETVLQDECSRLTPDESNEDDVELKNAITSEHRLSFRNLETDLNCDTVNKSAVVYNCIKTIPHLESGQSDREESPKHDTQLKILNNESNCAGNYHDSVGKNDSTHHADSLPNIENFKILKSESTVPASSQRSKHTPIMFDVSNSVDHHRTKKISSPDNKDNSSFPPNVFKDLRNNIDAEQKSAELSELKRSSLSKNDLRFELKKRKKAYSERSVLTVKTDKSAISKTFSKPADRLHRQRSRSLVRNSSRERKNCKRSRSRSPDRRHNRRARDRLSSSRSRSSSSYSSTSSVISSDSSPRLHSVSSVVQPIQSKIVVSDTQNNLKSSIAIKNSHQTSSESDNLTLKKGKGIEIKLKSLSNIKISVPGNDRNNATEVKKRGPVHMRLGTLPRKRIIQMPKHIEAAFVSSTSSDEDNDVNSKCKKSNILVVTEMCGKKVDGISRRVEKKLLKRSDVPKTERGKVLR